jgi:hypothetical protein
LLRRTLKSLRYPEGLASNVPNVPAFVAAVRMDGDGGDDDPNSIRF